ncbi:MAG: hypothetical protein R3E32_29820 [Chitinophagales bacterium]
MIATIPLDVQQKQESNSVQLSLSPTQVKNLMALLEKNEFYDLLKTIEEQVQTDTIFMPKSFQDFSLRDVEEQLELTIVRTELFTTVPPLKVNNLLLQVLEMNKLVPLKSEKARSESMVFPVLVNMVARHKAAFTLFSGEKFEVDKTKGLTGYCDYLLCNKSDTYLITAPVFAIVEAKKADVEEALGQCAAAMVAAKRFNENHQSAYPTIYGVATSGKEWQFLQLKGNHLYIDEISYFEKTELEKIVGILEVIVGEFLEKI